MGMGPRIGGSGGYCPSTGTDKNNKITSVVSRMLNNISNVNHVYMSEIAFSHADI